MEAQTISNSPVSSATGSGAPPPTRSRFDRRPIHPAMDFDQTDGVASIGLVDTLGRPIMVQRARGGLPVQHSVEKGRDDTWRPSGSGRVIFPPPLRDFVAGRWAGADIIAFCSDGVALPWSFVLREVRDVLKHHIEFTRPEYASVAALWIAGTYVYMLFNAFPRLNINGPKASGKTKLLQLIAHLAFNGLHQIVPTPAVIFRLISPLRLTFCLDEIEGLGKTERKDIEAVLNSGYKRGASVTRIEGDGSNRHPVSYDVYAPMALGGIEGLNPILADRCLTVLTQPGLDRQRVNSEIDATDATFVHLRASLYRSALTHWPLVVRLLAVVRDQQDDYTILQGRPLELYRPLIALALAAGIECADWSFYQELRAHAAADADERDCLDPDGRALFEVLDQLFKAEPVITISPGELAPCMAGADGGPPLPATIGKLLKRYGLAGHQRRTNRGSQYSLTRELFEEQARRHRYAVGSAQATTETHD